MQTNNTVSEDSTDLFYYKGFRTCVTVFHQICKLLQKKGRIYDNVMNISNDNLWCTVVNILKQTFINMTARCS